MVQEFESAGGGLTGVLLTSDGKIYVRITAVDEDGTQRTILTTSEGKLITRLTGLDPASVQRTVLVSTKGEVRIFGDLDQEDSTTDVVAATESYTSDSFSTVGYKKIVGSCIADQPGTLHVEQSQNGTNWDIDSSFPVNVDLTGNRGAGFQVDILAPNARVRFVCLATSNTVFRLYTHVRVI